MKVSLRSFQSIIKLNLVCDMRSFHLLASRQGEIAMKRFVDNLLWRFLLSEDVTKRYGFLALASLLFWMALAQRPETGTFFAFGLSVGVLIFCLACRYELDEKNRIGTLDMSPRALDLTSKMIGVVGVFLIYLIWRLQEYEPTRVFNTALAYVLGFIFAWAGLVRDERTSG